VGELMSFAHRGNWADEKHSRYEALLQELVWIDIDDAVVLEAYARIDCSVIGKGRSFSKNDIWIAACARATGSTLLTTDKDFDHLQDTWIDLIWIDPNTGKTA
jgi:predicted nucleic acid-binding protein